MKYDDEHVENAQLNTNLNPSLSIYLRHQGKHNQKKEE